MIVRTPRSGLSHGNERTAITFCLWSHDSWRKRRWKAGSRRKLEVELVFEDLKELFIP